MVLCVSCFCNQLNSWKIQILLVPRAISRHIRQKLQKSAQRWYYRNLIKGMRLSYSWPNIRWSGREHQFDEYLLTKPFLLKLCSTLNVRPFTLNQLSNGLLHLTLRCFFAFCWQGSKNPKHLFTLIQFSVPSFEFWSQSALATLTRLKRR